MIFFTTYLKLLNVLPSFIKNAIQWSKNKFFDTPDLFIGQITALKLLLFSDRDAAD
jgi:hypothetical protein